MSSGRDHSFIKNLMQRWAYFSVHVVLSTRGDADCMIKDLTLSKSGGTVTSSGFESTIHQYSSVTESGSKSLAAIFLTPSESMIYIESDLTI